MNKFVKGSVAAGAGMVLLLGGAGSLAYWNTSTDLGASAINAGSLDISSTTRHVVVDDRRVGPGRRVDLLDHADADR